MTTQFTSRSEDAGEHVVEASSVQNNSETSLHTRSSEPADISALHDQAAASNETMKTSSNEWVVLYEGGTPENPIRVRIFKEPGT